MHCSVHETVMNAISGFLHQGALSEPLCEQLAQIYSKIQPKYPLLPTQGHSA